MSADPSRPPTLKVDFGKGAPPLPPSAARIVGYSPPLRIRENMSVKE